MLEREVTDVLLATLATILLFQLELSPTSSQMISVGIYTCIFQISINFLHLILRQLNRISDQGSTILVVLNAISVFVIFLSIILGSPAPIDGFLTEINNGYIILAYSICVISTLLVVLSKNAKLLAK